MILAGGGRYDRMRLRNSRNGEPATETTFDAFSPKASATLRLLGAGNPGGDALNVYGAYSHAFVPPRRPSSLVPDDVPLNLKPEDIDNYEGGVKASLLNGRLSFEGTYFWMKEDGVVLSRRVAQFFLPTNAGEQRYKGMETGVRLAVTPSISTYLNASFYRNRFGRFIIETEDGDEVLTGNRLPISPDHVVNWGANWSISPSLEAGVDIKHVGAVQADRANTFELDRYALVDAAVTWQREAVRLTLSGHNILNEEYYWNGDGETADPGRPRQVLLSMSLRLRGNRAQTP
jgi:outer membrane receptor protein involved in Fe transport